MDALLEKVLSRALGPAETKPSGVRLYQRGTLRLQPGKPWVPFQAEQVIRAAVPGFSWTAMVRMAPLVKVRIVDAFADGRGRLDVRLWRLFRLAKASGPEIDAGDLFRYLAEIPWCPFAWRDNPHLTIQAVDETHVDVSSASSDRDVSVRLTVDPAGDVVGTFAEDRPRLVGKRYVVSPWRGTFSDHAHLGGIRVPRRAVVTWLLDDGPFECFRGEVTELRIEP